MNDANTRNGSTFLPKGFREFFKSRLNEIFGLTIIIFITSIIVSFWSFDPNDPIYYFKSSTKETVNILGWDKKRKGVARQCKKHSPLDAAPI